MVLLRYNFLRKQINLYYVIINYTLEIRHFQEILVAVCLTLNPASYTTGFSVNNKEANNFEPNLKVLHFVPIPAES
jgi:hypothetical protein